MPITVVGSIAYDAVKTPFGERERMLGGAAVHFALAASFFEEVSVVGPVGEDFGESELEAMRSRGVLVHDVERVAGGETFFWRGEYGWDLNSRETLETRLGVFEGFQPKLSAQSRASDVLFLANIQPELQLQVREQLPGARFVALDSMNLWIDIARDPLIRAISSVDCLILNDAELRQLTGKPNLVSAAREILAWGASGATAAASGATAPGASGATAAGASGATAPGASGATAPGASGATAAETEQAANGATPATARRGPRVVVAKQGEYGAALVTDESFFALPAYPLENVIDPTGAGDTFAGGFVGYIAAHPDEPLEDELLRRAMAHGTALASFNVEEFGTERLERLTGEEIAARVRELAEMTRFSEAPLRLRA
jgi:sugar/nucleoside kinase (ribokinase family)